MNIGYKTVIDIVESRQNRVGFMSTEETIKFRSMVSEWVPEDELKANAYRDLVNLVLAYVPKSKRVNPLLFLVECNQSIRLERYRKELGKIFEYDEGQRAYLYLQLGTERDLNRLKSLNGKYIN